MSIVKYIGQIFWRMFLSLKSKPREMSLLLFRIVPVKQENKGALVMCVLDKHHLKPEQAWSHGGLWHKGPMSEARKIIEMHGFESTKKVFLRGKWLDTLGGKTIALQQGPGEEIKRILWTFSNFPLATTWAKDVGDSMGRKSACVLPGSSVESTWCPCTCHPHFPSWDVNFCTLTLGCALTSTLKKPVFSLITLSTHLI